MNDQIQYSGKGLIHFLTFVFRLFYFLFIIAIIITVLFAGFALINLNDPLGFQVPVDFHLYFSHKEELGVSNLGNNESAVFSIAYALGNVKLSNVPYSFLAFYSFIAIALYFQRSYFYPSGLP